MTNVEPLASDKQQKNTHFHYYYTHYLPIEPKAVASSAFCTTANRVDREPMSPHQLRKQSVATNESSDYSPATNSK